jgi:3-oxoadipate enol-lactonase
MIGSDPDTAATQFAANHLTTEIAGARKVVFPGVVHMVNMEQPERFNQIVLEFLADAVSV